MVEMDIIPSEIWYNIMLYATPEVLRMLSVTERRMSTLYDDDNFWKTKMDLCYVRTCRCQGPKHLGISSWRNFYYGVYMGSIVRIPISYNNVFVGCGYYNNFCLATIVDDACMLLRQHSGVKLHGDGHIYLYNANQAMEVNIRYKSALLTKVWSGMGAKWSADQLARISRIELCDEPKVPFLIRSHRGKTAVWVGKTTTWGEFKKTLYTLAPGGESKVLDIPLHASFDISSGVNDEELVSASIPFEPRTKCLHRVYDIYSLDCDWIVGYLEA